MPFCKNQCVALGAWNPVPRVPRETLDFDPFCQEATRPLCVNTAERQEVTLQKYTHKTRARQRINLIALVATETGPMCAGGHLFVTVVECYAA